MRAIITGGKRYFGRPRLRTRRPRGQQLELHAGGGGPKRKCRAWKRRSRFYRQSSTPECKPILHGLRCIDRNWPQHDRVHRQRSQFHEPDADDHRDVDRPGPCGAGAERSQWQQPTGHRWGDWRQRRLEPIQRHVGTERAGIVGCQFAGGRRKRSYRWGLGCLGFGSILHGSTEHQHAWSSDPDLLAQCW